MKTCPLRLLPTQSKTQRPAAQSHLERDTSSPSYNINPPASLAPPPHLSLSRTPAIRLYPEGMNETCASNTGLHALYSVGLNGAGTVTTSRSFSSLLAPSPSTVNAISSTAVGAKAGAGAEADNSVDTLDDGAEAQVARASATTSTTTSTAEESLKCALTASNAGSTTHAVPATSEKPGILVIARAMFAARVYGAAERAGIVPARDAHKERNRHSVGDSIGSKTQSSQNGSGDALTFEKSQQHEVKTAEHEQGKATATDKTSLEKQTAQGITCDASTATGTHKDTFVASRTNDELIFAHELAALQLELSAAQQALTLARAENASLRAGALRDDAETTHLRGALRAAERQALARAFDARSLAHSGLHAADERAALEASLEQSRSEAARARVLVDEMRRRVEALADVQRLAGAALDMAPLPVRQTRDMDSMAFLEPDATHLGALARLQNQRLDSFVFTKEKIGSTDEDALTDSAGDLSAEMAAQLTRSQQQNRTESWEEHDSADNSDDSIIIVTDMDSNTSSAPLLLFPTSQGGEQPKASRELDTEAESFQAPRPPQSDELPCQPIPVFHTVRPSLPPRIPKTAQVNGPKPAQVGSPNRLRSKPSLQRMAIANARRVSDQKHTFATRNRGNSLSTSEGPNARPRALKLKPLLLAARFAAAASVASRRRRANSSGFVSDSSSTTIAANEHADGEVTKNDKSIEETTAITSAKILSKSLNPCAQEFSPRKSPTQPPNEGQLGSSDTKHADDEKRVENAVKTPILKLTSTPNPDAACHTPRTTRAISVQILTARTARRERVLAQAKAGRNREPEKERAADSRVVSCPARAMPMRVAVPVRVSPRLPLALFVERDSEARAGARYQFRSVSLPNAPTSASASGAHTNPRASSFSTSRLKINSESGEVLVTAQRRLERKTSDTFGAIVPSGYWRRRSNNNEGRLQSSSPKRRLSVPRQPTSSIGSTKSQKARLTGKGRPRVDARRAFNELTNVLSVGARAEKESGRWLSA